VRHVGHLPRNNQLFMEPEGSLPCSPTTAPYSSQLTAVQTA